MRFKAFLGFVVVAALVFAGFAAPAFANTSISVVVNSHSRDPGTDYFTYSITAVAADFSSSGGACANPYYECSLTLTGQYSNGGLVSLGAVDITSGTSSPFTHTFSGSVQAKQIVGVNAAVTSNEGTASSLWVAVDETDYPTPSVAISGLTDNRDGSDNFTYSLTATASHFALLDGPCGNSYYECSLYAQALTQSGGTVSLGAVDLTVGSSSSASHTFSGSVSAPHIVAVQAVVTSSEGTTASPWTTVSDLYNPAPGDGTATATVNSVTRDPSTGYFTYDVTGYAYGYGVSGGTCYSNMLTCRLGLQTETADGGIQGLGSEAGLSGTSGSNDFTGNQEVDQVTAIRAYISGTGGIVYGSWVSVTDPWPAPTVKATITSMRRNGPSSLSYQIHASATHFLASNGPCYPTGPCQIGLEAETIDGGIQTIGTPSGINSSTSSAEFDGTQGISRISAIRAYIVGYAGYAYGDWDHVFDPGLTEVIAGSNPAEPGCGCGRVDPVNTATGEFYENATDLGIAGVGPALQVTRSYSSVNAAQNGPFGYGWSTNFESNLSVLDTGTGTLPQSVQITQENGSTVEFDLTAGGTYAAGPQVLASLTHDATSGDWTFTRLASEIFVFNSSGQLLTMQDLHGNTVTYTYSSGDVSTISASGGRSISLTWSGGHVTSVADSAGRSVSYGYDGSGNLTSVEDVDSNTSAYGYDSGHYLTTTTKPDGGVTTNTYDSSHRVVTQTDAVGRETTFTYDTYTTTTTTADGAETVDTFVGGLLASETHAAGTADAATTSYTYDASNNMISETDPLGHTTSYTYDAAGNMLTKTDPLSRTTTWTYDGLNDPLTVTDPLSRETVATYDADGDKTSETSPSGRVQHWTYNADGTVATWEDARSETTSYTYDGAGNEASATDPDGHVFATDYNSAEIATSTTDPAGHSTTLTVDAAGNTLTSTDPLSHVTTYTYDGDANRTSVEDPTGHTSSTTYDDADQVTSTTDARGKTTHYTYSDGGDLASTEDPDSHTTTETHNKLGELTSITNADSKTTTYAYDLDGNQTSVTLPSTTVTSKTYNDDGTVATETNGDGKTTSYAYDADQEVTATTDPLSRVTADSYTADGQVHVVTLPDSSTETYTYTADGQQASFTNADGKTTTYSYDDADLLTSKTEPGSVTTGYSYNTAGLLSVTTNPDATTVTDTYDNAGQLTRVQYSAAGSTDTTYGYDADGRRTSMTDSTGSSSYGYNNDGQLTSETNGAGKTIGYAYNDAGLTSSITYPGSHTVTYGYDDANQMTSLTDWSSNETDFTWTDNGQLNTQADPNGVTQTSTYDNAGQTTGISDAVSGSTIGAFTYGYDDAGELTSTGTAGSAFTSTSQTVGYDDLNQLASTTTGGTTSTIAATPAGELTTMADGSTLGYNTAQELTSLTPTTGPATSYTYDSNGSRLTSTVAAAGATPAATTTYAYDPAANLESVTLPGATSPSVSYTSDGDGLRETRTTSSGTTDNLWDTQRSLPLLLDDGTHSYLYGASSAPIAQIDDSTGTIQYLLGDVVGSTRMTTNASGTVAGTYTYDAYGNQTAHTGTATSAIGYSGNLSDPIGGLVYLRDRNYDSTTAQFTTIDPLVDQTLQPYAYVANNPLLATDPSGDGGPVPNNPSSGQSELGDGVAGNLGSFLTGFGDGASAGTTALLTNSLVPEADCQLRSNPWAYWPGVILGAGALIVATGGVAALLEVPEGAQIVEQEEDEAAVAAADDAAIAYATGPQKLAHIFALKHNLEPLVKQYGSQQAAVTQMLSNIKGLTPASGQFEVETEVGGQQVVVRGAVVNGVTKIGTAFTP